MNSQKISLKKKEKIFLENKTWHVILIVSKADSLKEISGFIFCEKWEKYFNMLSVAVQTRQDNTWYTSGEFSRWEIDIIFLIFPRK